MIPPEAPTALPPGVRRQRPGEAGSAASARAPAHCYRCPACCRRLHDGRGAGAAPRGGQAAAAGRRAAQGRQVEGGAGQGARGRRGAQQDAGRAADHRPHARRGRAACRRPCHGHPGLRGGVRQRQAVGARAGAGGRVAGLCLCADQQRGQGPGLDRQGAGRRRQQRATEAVAGLPARPVRRLRSDRARRRRGGEHGRTGRPAPVRGRPAAPGRCLPAHQQPGLQRHAGKAARLLPEEGVLGRLPWAAATQARFRRPLRPRRDAPEAGQRHDEQDRGLHGNGAARAAGRLPGRGRRRSSSAASPPARWAAAPRPNATSGCATWR